MSASGWNERCQSKLQHIMFHFTHNQKYIFLIAGVLGSGYTLKKLVRQKQRQKHWQPLHSECHCLVAGQPGKQWADGVRWVLHLFLWSCMKTYSCYLVKPFGMLWECLNRMWNLHKSSVLPGPSTMPWYTRMGTTEQSIYFLISLFFLAPLSALAGQYLTLE